MSRKDYERIADAMKRAYWQMGDKSGERVKYEVYVGAVADAFRADNPAFKRDKFYEACGL